MERILFTIPNFISAGSGHAMLNVIRRLDRDRFEPAVCVLKKGGRLDAEVERLGIPLLEATFTVSGKPYITLVQRAFQAAQFFRPYRFGLWHSYHYSSDYTEPLIARFAGARSWIYTKKNMSWGKRAWYLRSLFASSIGAQNTDMIAHFFSSWPLKNKAHYLPPGVDLQVFRPDIAPTLHLRSSLNIPSQALVIASVANLLPVKGHPILIQAFAQLRADPQPHLWLAGKELEIEYASSLKRLVQELGLANHVHFLGHIDNIPALLSEVDIFSLTSQSIGEGCPIAMLEAMACGKACVGSNIPGIRDQIVNKTSGLLVPAEEPQALGGALQSVLDHPDFRTRLGNNARLRVQEYFSIELEASRYQNLYQESLRMSAMPAA